MAGGKHRAPLIRLLGVAVTLLCASCSHFEAIAPVGAQAQEVVGHSVRILTVDGETLEFHVHKVTEEGVFGPSRRVPFDRIRTLERRQFGLWETVALVGLIAGGLLAYVMLDYSTSW